MELSPDDIGDVRAVLIAGPTASGKSSAALRLAEHAARKGRAAWIVNADSMQVYGALRLLTARPGEADEERAPHRLYGHVGAATRYSVGAWLRDAATVVAEAQAANALPIVVGGTGLYFKALTQGLAAMPAVPPQVRERWSIRLAAEGAAALHACLAIRDPLSAASIRPNDAQRVQRALEVLEATGVPLGNWHAARAAPPLLPPPATMRIVMEVDRPELRRRIGERLDRMVEEGALDEVAGLLRLRLDPDMPVMKAIGVRQFGAFLRKEIALEDAMASAKLETRRYAKRQTTWFRNQMPGWGRS